MPVAVQEQFVYHQIVNVEERIENPVSGIAAAIGEPARVRMLYRLMDGHARTSTELAIVAGVSPSTASTHLNRLKEENLVKVHVQGKHRYYSLQGPEVASVLEGLSVLAGGSHTAFVPNTPTRLRAARSCYDHIAGTLGVSLHDRFKTLGWIFNLSNSHNDGYDLSQKGITAFETLGIDIEEVRRLRRRFACACLDWSERRPHLGGALGAALMKLALKRRWISQDLDSRALSVANLGRREMLAHFGLHV